MTFDDLLLVPQASSVLPNEVSLKTKLTGSITLNAPLVSAAMDTVTEHRVAIAMAREGGIGVIHKNMGIDQQVLEVERVKKSESGMIIDPITVNKFQSVAEVQDIMSTYKISGLPVLHEGKLVGIVTNRGPSFCLRYRPSGSRCDDLKKTGDCQGRYRPGTFQGPSP